MHFYRLTRAPPRSGCATYTCFQRRFAACAAARAAPSSRNTPNTAAPLPVIRAVTAPCSRSRVLMAPVSFAPLHSSSEIYVKGA